MGLGGRTDPLRRSPWAFEEACCTRVWGRLTREPRGIAAAPRALPISTDRYGGGCKAGPVPALCHPAYAGSVPRRKAGHDLRTSARAGSPRSLDGHCTLASGGSALGLTLEAGFDRRAPTAPGDRRHVEGRKNSVRARARMSELETTAAAGALENECCPAEFRGATLVRLEPRDHRPVSCRAITMGHPRAIASNRAYSRSRGRPSATTTSPGLGGGPSGQSSGRASGVPPEPPDSSSGAEPGGAGAGAGPLGRMFG